MINTIEIKDMDKLVTAMGGAVDLDNLSDVTITSAASGNVLKYNGTKWVNGSISEVPDTTGATAGLWVPVPEAAEAGYVLTAKADGTVEWVDPSAEVSTAKKTTKKS